LKIRGIKKGARRAEGAQINLAVVWNGTVSLYLNMSIKLGQLYLMKLLGSSSVLLIVVFSRMLNIFFEVS